MTKPLRETSVVLASLLLGLGQGLLVRLVRLRCQLGERLIGKPSASGFDENQQMALAAYLNNH